MIDLACRPILAEDFAKSGKLRVLFNSNPIEFKEQSVLMEVAGEQREIPNDFVWIFAGGTPPNEFLKKVGVGFGARDMTKDASDEAKQTYADLIATWTAITP